MKRSKCTAKIAIVISIIICMILSLGCAVQTVSALDYSLENVLYTDQSQQDEPVEVTDNADEQTSTEPVETDTTEVTPEPEATTSPETTPADATPTPSPTEQGDAEATQQPETYRYTILVLDESGAALSGARVTVYQDGELLYSEIVSGEGSVFWMLPQGHSYYARAALTGYQQTDNGSNVTKLDQDRQGTIILAAATQEGDSETEPTPLPVPSAAEGKVTITADNVTIQIGQTTFSLLDGVSAKTEYDQSVPVWVVKNGGFQVDTAGEYTVTYGALQDGAMITATRTITVQSETDAETETTTTQSQVSAPTGSSKERYEILLAYRNEVSADLGAKIAQLNADFQKKVAALAAENEEARVLAETTTENDTDEMASTAKDVQQTYDATVTNWPDVLATFLALNVSDEEKPLDVDLLLSIPLDKLDSVFWDMNSIDVYRIDGQTNVLLAAKTYEDMVEAYHMSDKRVSFLYELMQPEFQRTFASLTGSTAFASATEGDVEQLIETLPADVNIDRKQVVETALSLVGKVKYVWGGKYNSLGWSSAWGKLSDEEAQKIGAVTSKSAIKGLDCSGFVSWTFINATGDPTVLSAIGNGSNNQWARTSAIGWDEGLPGDLVFFYAPGERQYNHVGIIVSVDNDGSYLVAHCSSKQHGVVVTDGWSTGFRYIRRPIFFQ